jgi:hypothetical protein
MVASLLFEGTKVIATPCVFVSDKNQFIDLPPGTQAPSPSVNPMGARSQQRSSSVSPDRDARHRIKKRTDSSATKEKATCKKVALCFLKPGQGFHKFFSGLKAGFLQGKTW